MSEVRDNLYLGLPVLNMKEFEATQELAFGGNAQFPMDQIVSMVHRRRPLIAHVIAFDTVINLNELNEPNPLSSREAAAFEEGMRKGYNFMLGCVTFASYLRSQHTRADSFIEHTPKRSIVLPVRKSSQLRRVKLWLGGDALHEPPRASSEHSDGTYWYIRCQ